MQNLDMNKKKIIFDIDGTLLETKGIEGGYELINQNDRILDWMNGVNKWYDEYEFEAFTARGSKSGFDFKDITYKQLEDIPISSIKFGKPDADWYVDDKAINVRNFVPNVQSIEAEGKHWGIEHLLVKTDKYVMKRLEILPGKSLSKQYHEHKHETLHVVEGCGYAEINGEFRTITVGDTIDLPPKTIHRIMASDSCWRLVIIEASTIELNDVVRLEEYK